MKVIGKQVWSGIVIIVVTTLLMGSYSVYSDISSNTNHRLGSIIHEDKMDYISEVLVRIETNQKILLNKYNKDVNK